MNAAVAAIDIGQSGTWIGPLLVGLASGGLDYSAAGPAALRDRVAVAGYFASAVSFAELTGWTPWIRGAFASYDWRVFGAVANLAVMGALLIVWIGRPRKLAAQLAGVVKFAGTDSQAAKINQTLLGWTITAALTSPLAGDGTWGRIVDSITTATTGFWGATVGALINQWLGG